MSSEPIAGRFSRQSTRGHRVVISSNVKYGAYMAAALQGRGVLDRYYSNVVLTKPLKWPWRFASSTVADINATRLIPELHAARRSHSVLAAPEMLFRLSSRPSLSLSLARRVEVYERLFDLDVAVRLNRPTVFQFTSGAGLIGARKAKRAGAYVICERRALHHEVEIRRVKASLGSGESYQHPEARLAGVLNAEYDIADLIICNSELTRQSFIEAGVHRDKLVVVHRGVDLHSYRLGPPPDPLDNRPLKVLYAGSLDERKGVTFLISALKDASIATDVRIAGTGSPDFTKSLRDALPTASILGAVKQDALIQHYHWADILVLPSLADAFGMVATEAMACGTPVIVTDQCGVAEMVEPGLTGFIVPAASPGAISQALTSASKPAFLSKAYSTLAVKRDKLAWSSVMRDYIHILNCKVLEASCEV